jgi:serine/threonine protein kinase
MSHLIRIHWAGVQHNDIEPRNILFSPSKGPIIIDFDSASLHHHCEDQQCGELSKLADRLGLNLGQFSAPTGTVLDSLHVRLDTELHTTKRVTGGLPDILAVAVLVCAMFLMFVWKYV